MQRSISFWGLCLLAATCASAADKPAQLVEESWEVAQIEGARAGSLHTTVQLVEVDGGKRYRARSELDLTFKRYNTPVRLRIEQATEETPEGKVVAVSLRQGPDKGPQLTLVGTLDGDRMHVRVDNGRIERRLPWSDQAVGLYRREHLFQDRKPKPGDQFSFVRFEPTVNRLVTVRVVVGEPESVTLPAGKKALLRVDMTPEKIEAPGQTVQLPPEIWWLDDDFIPARRQIELDGLGAVTLTRTTREEATAAAAPAARLTDIGLKTLVPLNRPIPRPYQTSAAVYRVTLKGDPDPGSALVCDAHQEVKNVRGNTFELHVHPVRPAPAEGAAERPGAEYLESSHFLDWQDARVKERARQAVGEETDAWKKARRIEKWVKQNMKPDNGTTFCPAGQVARDLRGDCRMYALLTTVLCRAEGVPARTAVGLLYVERGSRPQLGFHMWTEVWIAGRWLGLDGTLGLGGVSAAHVKIADHSWHDTQSLTPLLPVSRILGKVAIEVVETDAAD
jgi:hypothetical protein